MSKKKFKKQRFSTSLVKKEISNQEPAKINAAINSSRLTLGKEFRQEATEKLSYSHLLTQINPELYKLTSEEKSLKQTIEKFSHNQYFNFSQATREEKFFKKTIYQGICNQKQTKANPYKSLQEPNFSKKMGPEADSKLQIVAEGIETNKLEKIKIFEAKEKLEHEKKTFVGSHGLPDPPNLPPDDLIKTDFATFFKVAFAQLNPKKDIQDQWFFPIIFNQLNQLENDEIGRMIFNLPPRQFKSTIISVIWPAWLLAKDPGLEILCASASRELAVNFSKQTRMIMLSDWYIRLFSETRILKGRNNAHHFYTSCNGSRFAATTSSDIMGFGGDYLILDDPQNPTKMRSINYREKTKNWFQEIFVNRINNANTGKIILATQRLHEFDLTADILSSDQFNVWNQLSLPMVAVNDEYFIINDREITREKGEILNINMYKNREEVEKRRVEIGEEAYMAQFQQNPIANENAIITEKMLKYYDYVELAEDLRLKRLQIVQSWDTASSPKFDAAFSVGTTWAVKDNNYYLIAMFREQLEYHDLKEAMIKEYHTYAFDTPDRVVLIENKDSGRGLISELKRLFRVEEVNPVGSKRDRLKDMSFLFKNGMVFLPRSVSWLNDVKEELLNFGGGQSSRGNSKHSDIVDSMTQFLNYANQHRKYAAILPKITVFEMGKSWSV